jgi:hypothetical protein
MANVPDSITLGELVKKAAQALTRAGLDRRIDLYREVEIDDPAVRLMLGRSHRVRVRIKITAKSLLFEGNGAPGSETERDTETGPEVTSVMTQSNPEETR